MAGTIRAGGKRRLAAVIHLEDNRVAIVAQAQRAGGILQPIRAQERPEDIREGGEGAEVGRVARDDEVAARVERGVRGEDVVHRAGETPAAEFLDPRLGVVDFDKLQVLPIHAIRRMIHHLGNHHALPARRRADGFAWQREIADVDGRSGGAEGALGIRQNGVGRRGAVTDVVHRERVSRVQRHRRGREDDGAVVRPEDGPDDGDAAADRVVAGVGGRGRLDRLGEDDEHHLRLAEIADGVDGRLRRVGNYRQEGGGTVGAAEGIGDAAEVSRVAVRQRDGAEGKKVVRPSGNGDTVAMPLKPRPNHPLQQDGERRRAALDDAEIGRLLRDDGWPKSIDEQAVVGNGFLDGAVGQTPAHRQIVAAAAFLLERLDVVLLAGGEEDVGR